MQTIIEVFGWVLFAIWAVLSGIPTLWLVGRSLKRQSERVPEPSEWPFVSVIVPARDEGNKIEAGLKSLLASDYPNFEIIAIDDRSSDATGAIMDRLAQRSPLAPREEPSVQKTSETSTTPETNSTSNERSAFLSRSDRATMSDRATLGDRVVLRVIHITELPANWLGKNHALQVGAQQAAGEWLLFTDGDVVHKSDTLRRTIRFAVGRQIDHLPLFPDIEAASIFEAAFVACFGLLFAVGTQPWLVSTRVPRAYIGVGAFNLVRRKAFDKAGGFEPIKLDVMDDVKLGKLLKQTGHKAAVLRAADGLSIRWQQGAWACITGLEKNAFASANYSVLQLLWMLCVIGTVIVGPVLGIFLAGDARTGYVAATVLSHALYGFNARLFGHSVWLFPMLIPSGLGFLFAYARSAWITLRQGGVRWRDTLYPLELLRKNIYR